FLGEYVRRKTGRRMHLWPADCHVHGRLRPEDLDRARAAHPGAPVVAHPECGCLSEALPAVDQVLSTDGMIRYAETTRAPEVLVATEVGILHRMRAINPGTVFTPLDAGAICPYMKATDLVDIRDALAQMRYRIDVDPSVAARARRALDRMVAA
ncbi:MAG: quinolinate synthase NadA, partial [Thermoplasmata archaeon]